MWFIFMFWGADKIQTCKSDGICRCSIAMCGVYVNHINVHEVGGEEREHNTLIPLSLYIHIYMKRLFH